MERSFPKWEKKKLGEFNLSGRKAIQSGKDKVESKGKIMVFIRVQLESLESLITSKLLLDEGQYILAARDRCKHFAEN